MSEQLNVQTDHTGLPYAEVPFSRMWELVEYLSFQRVAVSYQYRPTHFVVTFPRQSKESAQLILDRWAESYSSALQAVG